MFGLKMSELLIILVIALVLFGGAKLPQLGSSLGQAIRNFKKGFGGDDDTPNDTSARPGGTLAQGEAEAKVQPRSTAPTGKDV
jgi:TatA/E family protein of Tat protein translocase